MIESRIRSRTSVAAIALLAFSISGANVLSAADFTVDGGTVLVPNYIGHGTEYNQNLYASISAADGITPENVADLEGKVVSLGSQHVRIFFDTKAFDTVNYPDYMDSFIRTVQLAQNSGATVNITYWHGPYTNIPQQMSDFAGVLYDLIVTRGLTAVQYVTIQNEVNSTTISMATYESLYRELDSSLVALGIRGSVNLIGGDLVRTNQQAWFDYMAAYMNDVLDGYSIHIYWTYNDRGYAATRLSEVRAIVDAMDPSTQKPVYITEYGVRGVRPDSSVPQPGYLSGTTTPIMDTNIAAFQHAWFQMLSMQYGYAATVKWDAYKAKYDSGTQYYSEIGSGTDGYPLKPAYYQSKVFTYTSKPGYQVVNVAGSVAGQMVSALKNPATGDTTVYALNDTTGDTTISVGGLGPNASFYLTIWNDDGLGGITNGGLVTADAAGEISLTLPVQSVAALSTIDPGL